ncbi:MAG: glycosyltransferase family 4 protein [Actinomycetota bacterium]|nr:glycosyltransferase family 4 protein [Actinomycetota bacterium]
MRIAVLSSVFLPGLGGAEVGIHNRALALMRAGHRVVIVPSLASYRLVGRMPYTVVPLWRRAYRPAIEGPNRPDGGPAQLGSLRRQLGLLQRVFRFDAWHVHFIYPTAWAALDVLEELEAAVAVSAHGSDVLRDDGSGAGLDPADEERARSVARRAPCLFAGGPGLATALRELGADDHRLRMLPDGWDRGRADLAIRRRERTKSALGAEARPLVLTVARHDPIKRYDLALDAAAFLASREPRPLWVMVTPNTASLEAEVARRGLEEVVRVVSGGDLLRSDRRDMLPRARVMDLHAAADVLVIPSRWEGAPNVIGEAQSVGTPIVATRGGAAGGVRDAVDGVLVPADTPEFLAGSIATVLDDTDLRGDLRAGAFAAREQRPTWDVAVATEVEFLDQLR